MSTQTSGLTPDHILQTGLAFWASKTLLSAIEMGLFTELADGPQTFERLSEKLRLHPRSARDFLDALVALKFLDRTSDTCSNTPESGPVSRQAKAELHWRDSGDGQRKALRILGSSDRGAADRLATERGQERRDGAYV